LGYNSLLPSYVFASNIKETSSCIFEAMVLNIPCSALIDSNIGFYGIFYGIPSNDDNFVGIYLYTRLFIRMYLKSVFDNINSLKLEEDLNLIDNGIKLGFIFENLSNIKTKYKNKYFIRNKLPVEQF
jgi:ribosomal protein S2